MVIISKTSLNKFGTKHPGVVLALNAWYSTVKGADWGSLADIRKDFNTVDYVSDNRYVFNLKGNHYRLAALIFFSVRTVYINIRRHPCGV